MEKKKGEGGGEETGWDLHPRVGEMKQRRDSQIWGNPLSDREINWDRRKHLRLSEEGEVADLWQTGQSEKYTYGPDHGSMCPRLGCVFTGVQEGWELMHGDWRTGPERKLLLAVRRQTEGMGGRKSAAGNAYGGRLHCHWVLLLSHTQGEEPLM